MHEVRIHPNGDSGVLWWAEDDSGFNGGSDSLDDLLAKIGEYVDDEPEIGDWRAVLVPSVPPPGDIVHSAVKVNAPRPHTTGSGAVAISQMRVLETV